MLQYNGKMSSSCFRIKPNKYWVMSAAGNINRVQVSTGKCFALLLLGIVLYFIGNIKRYSEQVWPPLCHILTGHESRQYAQSI